MGLCKCHKQAEWVLRGGTPTSKELMNGSWGPDGIVFITDFNRTNGLLPNILYVSLQMFRK